MPISPYIARLRARIGHDLITLPGVSACIFDEVGRVLLAHHVDSGMWALPGGAVEPDEDPAAAMAREVREELGIETTFRELIGVYGGPEFRINYPNGDQVSYVAIVYGRCGLDVPTRLDPREVDEIRFVADLDGLPCARWVPSVHADAVRWWRARPGPGKR